MKSYRIVSREIIESWDVSSKEQSDEFCASVKMQTRAQVLDLLSPGWSGVGGTKLARIGEIDYQMDLTEDHGLFMVSLHQHLDDDEAGDCFARSTFWIIEAKELKGTN